MHDTDREKQKRVVLIRALVDMLSLFKDRCGEEPEEVFISMIIRLGAYTNRPFDVSAIAEAARMPRTNVIRHLVSLRKKNLINSVKIGRRTIPFLTQRANNSEIDKFYGGLERVSRRLMRELTEMDSFVDDKTKHGN